MMADGNGSRKRGRDTEEEQLSGLLILLDRIDPLWRRRPIGRLHGRINTARLRNMLRVAIVQPLVAVVRQMQHNETQTMYLLGRDVRFREVRHEGTGLSYYACVYKRDDQADEVTAYIMVPKAPTQLSLEILHTGMRSIMVRRLASGIHVPQDRVTDVPLHGSDQELARLLDIDAETTVLQAFIPTLRCMIHAGVTYGCIATLEAFVFVKIQWDTDPVTFLYHVDEPKEQVTGHPLGILRSTAIGQTLGFTVIALDGTTRERPCRPRDRERAFQCVEQWQEWADDVENRLRL